MKLLKVDRLNIVLFFLSAFSLLTILSLSLAWGSYALFIKQAIFFLLGFLLMILLAKFLNFNYIKTDKFFSLFFYLLILASLILVLVQPTRVHGVKAWFVFHNFYFQPSELAKLALTLILAKYFSKRHIEIWRWRHIFISGTYFALFFILVAIEPDLGNAIILAFIWLAVILAARVRLKQIIIIFLVGILVAMVGWHSFLKPYQKERLLSFFHPSENVLGSGYQAREASIAIGEGGVFGTGLARGIQTRYRFLPQAQSDFIFATFIENWGFLGGVVLFFFYFLLFFELFKKAEKLDKASGNFGRLFIFGYLSLLFVQIFIHVGGNLDLLPITGITLPFLSYGGSNLLINFIFLGIIEAM